MSSSDNTINSSGTNRSKVNDSTLEKEDKSGVPQFDPSKLGTSKPDLSEKIVNLIESTKVQSMRESGKEYIDIDIEHLEQGKFYHVLYRGDDYGIEKLPDGEIAFYEVID
jgi:predicted small secreted protein